MRMSLGQFDVSQGEINANLKTISELAAEASSVKSDLLCLPEMATTGFNWMRNRELLDESDHTPRALADLALKYSISICGSFLERTEKEGMANTLYFFSKEGEILGQYRKIHLFTQFDEGRYVEAGNRPLVIDTAVGKIGFGICYDLRFPEQFRKNNELGAALQLLPAAFPHPRLEHWRTLIRARAIENQSFFVATNQSGCEAHVGKSVEIKYFGHSMIVDPWGEIIAEGGESEALISAEIDLAEVTKTRAILTAWKDRRPNLF